MLKNFWADSPSMGIFYVRLRRYKDFGNVYPCARVVMARASNPKGSLAAGKARYFHFKQFYHAKEPHRQR